MIHAPRAASSADPARLEARLGMLPLFTRYGLAPGDLARRLAEAISRGDGLMVADDEAGPCAMAWFLGEGTFAAGGYLRLIAVAPGAGLRGFGSALLEEVERQVSGRSRNLFLLVSDFNQDAQRFYARRGYTPAGRLAGFVRPDIDELIYWKRLR
jgi:GNAT superfamily N-acetyltransferase